MTKFYVTLDDLYVTTTPKKFSYKGDSSRNYLTDKIEKARVFKSKSDALKCINGMPGYVIMGLHTS